MSTIQKRTLSIAIIAPLLIFIANTFIVFSNKFKEHSSQLSIGILCDLLVVAPLAYYLVIRKSTISKLTVLRIFTLGLFVATLLLSNQHNILLEFIKTWIAPCLEIALVSFIIWKFYKARQLDKNQVQIHTDFLIHTRSILTSVLGNEKAANMMASEVSVFYYLFCKKPKLSSLQFTSHKENGIIIVLYTFLFLCLLETVIMHFVFVLWSNTAAWILSGLSAYTCLQLLAHIRAIYVRPSLITTTEIILRNGLLGGDVIIDRDSVERIELNNKEIIAPDIISMAFLKTIENHNVVIYLKQPIVVTKAFGIKKTAKVILTNIDDSKGFLQTLYLEKEIEF